MYGDIALAFTFPLTQFIYEYIFVGGTLISIYFPEDTMQWTSGQGVAMLNRDAT